MAIPNPKGELQFLDMTPERKARMARATGEITRIVESLPDLTEKFAVLDCVRSGIERCYGVRCFSTVLEHNEKADA